MTELGTPPTEAVQVKVPPRGSPSVSRAAAILNLLAQRPGGWSLTQIAAALGLAKSSTLSIMTSLESAGLVSRSDNSYELDVGILTPAGGFLRGVDIVTLFKRHLASSKVLSGEIAHLALLAGTEVTYIARHIGRPPLPVTANVGDRFPASITSVGAALLAEETDAEIERRYARAGADFPRWTTDSTPDVAALLAKVQRAREAGYAVDQGETHPNVVAYGLVVHRVGNHVQDLAMSTSLELHRTTAKSREKALEELMRIRDALENGNELR